MFVSNYSPNSNNDLLLKSIQIGHKTVLLVLILTSQFKLIVKGPGSQPSST